MIIEPYTNSWLVNFLFVYRSGKLLMCLESTALLKPNFHLLASEGSDVVLFFFF